MAWCASNPVARAQTLRDIFVTVRTRQAEYALHKLLLEKLLQEADAQVSVLTAQAEWLQLLITLRHQCSAWLIADRSALQIVEAELGHWRRLQADIDAQYRAAPSGPGSAGSDGKS